MDSYSDYLALNALEVITDTGVILLHDAGRKDYQGIIKLYNGEVLAEGETEIRGGGYAHRGLALFRKQV